MVLDIMLGPSGLGCREDPTAGIAEEFVRNMILRHCAGASDRSGGDGGVRGNAAGQGPGSLDERLSQAPASALALLRQLLDLSPSRRIAAAGALESSFLAETGAIQAGAASAGAEPDVVSAGVVPMVASPKKEVAEHAVADGGSERNSEALASNLAAVEAEITAMSQMQAGTVVRRRIRSLLWAELHDDALCEGTANQRE